MGIRYTDSVDGITADMLTGFFVDWPNPPDAETHLRILQSSDAVCLALDGDRCVGFITALTDGVLFAYIPLLEVLPEYQGQGIGSELVRRMVDRFRDIYGIDLACDASVAPFYERLGFAQCAAMVKRNHANQSGRSGV